MNTAISSHPSAAPACRTMPRRTRRLLALLVLGACSVAHTAGAAAGAPITVSPATATIPGAAAVAITPPWTPLDIGVVGAIGSYASSNGQFRVAGAGADIWGVTDAFQFVSQPLVGDGSITARVLSQTPTADWAKAGVMFRETRAPGSRFAVLAVTPRNGLVFEARTATGTSAVRAAAARAGTAPYWLRITRAGNVFSCAVSVGGVTWSPVGKYTVAMASQLQVGLAVTSHAVGALSTAVFDHVVVAAKPSVAIVPTSATVPFAGSQQFTATGPNASNPAVKWFVNGVAGGNSAIGTISTTGLYRAPANAPASRTVAIAAVSVSDPGRSAVASVTVGAVSTAVSVTVTPSLASIAAPSGTVALAARVLNGKLGTVTWRVNGVVGGNATVGTISAAGRYTAPAAVPVPATVTVAAVSVDDPTRSATAGITVTSTVGHPTISGSAPATATVGKPYSFTPTTTKASGTTLTFSITNQPAWAAFSKTSGTLSGTPTARSVGTYANVSISVSDGRNSVAMAPFTITTGAGSTGSATLRWSAPTTRTDGTPLTNLAGYRIYYGNAPGRYPNGVSIPNPGLSSYVLANLASATYYFVITAYDAAGAESNYSAAASKIIP